MVLIPFTRQNFKTRPNYGYTVKGTQCHINNSGNGLKRRKNETKKKGKKKKKKKKKKKQKTKKIFLFKHLLCCSVLALTHHTFTQLDVPTQDLPSWLD